jgi:formamidopyrimidine-DNA glycosylase
MDQKFVAGLGNIYCNEILFLCKITPTRSVSKINHQEKKKIMFFIKKILKQAIMLGGSSIKNFSSTGGQEGNFQQKFNVYNKDKVSCNRLKCLGIIRKVYTSNRSSFFCPKCQK